MDSEPRMTAEGAHGEIGAALALLDQASRRLREIETELNERGLVDCGPVRDGECCDGVAVGHQAAAKGDASERIEALRNYAIVLEANLWDARWLAQIRAAHPLAAAEMRRGA